MKYIRYEYEIGKSNFFEAEVTEDSYLITMDKYKTYSNIFKDILVKKHDYTKDLETTNNIEILETFIQKEKDNGIELSELVNV